LQLVLRGRLHADLGALDRGLGFLELFILIAFTMALAFSCGMPWVSVMSRRTVSFAAGVTAPSSRFFTGTLRLMSFDCSTSNKAFILKSSSATRVRTALARSNASDAFEPLKS